MRRQKKRLLVFHQALAPYRVDFWNSLNELFDLKVYFVYENLLDQKFDQQRLRSLLNFEPNYLHKGFRVGVRAFRWGYASIIRRFKPDIVFTYEYSQTTLSVYLIKKLLGLNYQIYSVCDDSLHIAQTCSGPRKFLRGYLINRIDGLILVNEEVANWYRKELKLKKAIVFPIIARESVFRKGLKEAIPLSNNLLKQHNLAGKKCVFYIGRFIPVKGVDRLIKGFSMVCSRHPDAVLIVIGDGEMREELKLLAEKAGLPGRCIFPGRFEGRELQAWYNIGQIFVLASHYEPFGAVVNEALLSGASVLCSTSAGASALIREDENGAIFDPYNIDQLSALLNKTLENTSRRDYIEEIRDSRMSISYDQCVNNLYDELHP